MGEKKARERATMIIERGEILVIKDDVKLKFLILEKIGENYFLTRPIEGEISILNHEVNAIPAGYQDAQFSVKVTGYLIFFGEIFPAVRNAKPTKVQTENHPKIVDRLELLNSAMRDSHSSRLHRR